MPHDLAAVHFVLMVLVIVLLDREEEYGPRPRFRAVPRIHFELS